MLWAAQLSGRERSSRGTAKKISFKIHIGYEGLADSRYQPGIFIPLTRVSLFIQDLSRITA
jgi:hypothetical protein